MSRDGIFLFDSIDGSFMKKLGIFCTEFFSLGKMKWNRIFSPNSLFQRFLFSKYRYSSSANVSLLVRNFPQHNCSSWLVFVSLFTLTCYSRIETAENDSSRAGRSTYSLNHSSSPLKYDIGKNGPPLLRELSKIIREDQIELDVEERKAKVKSWNSYHKVDILPIAVIYPESTEETSKILKLCYKYNMPVVAFGGGTSLEGHTLPTSGGISLDFSRMKKIISLHEPDLDATVEAGIGYVELNEYLKPKGLWFPLDPGSNNSTFSFVT